MFAVAALPALTFFQRFQPLLACGFGCLIAALQLLWLSESLMANWYQYYDAIHLSTHFLRARRYDAIVFPPSWCEMIVPVFRHVFG